MDTTTKRSRGRPRRSTRARSRRRSRRSTGRCAILKVLAGRRGHVADRARRGGRAGAGDGLPGALDLRGARHRRDPAGDAALVRRPGGVPHRQRVPRPHQPRRAGARGDARADGGDRRDGEPRHRRRRAGGLHQPGRDARADPRLLPAGHARADPCQRASARRCSPIMPPEAIERIVREQGLAGLHARARSPTRRGWPRSWRRSARGAGRWTTRSAPRACAASRRRSSTSSARRSPGCRCRGRRSDGAARRALGDRVRAAADRITRAIGGTAP